MQYRKFCFFDSALIFAFLSTLGITRANNDEYKLCTSEICIETGNEIMKGLDISVAPCDNFFNHVCGRWLENHPPPSDTHTWNQWNIVQEKTLKRLKAMLENNEMTKTEATRKVRDYYLSCLKIDDYDVRGLAPLEEIVLANGGWSLLLPNNQIRSNDKKLTFQQGLENYGKVTGYALFSFGISPVPVPSTGTYVLMLFIDPNTPIRRHLSSSPHLAYSEYIMAVAEAFAESGGYNVSTAELQHDVANMLAFESSLNELYDNMMNTSSKPFYIVPISVIQEKWDAAFITQTAYSINWVELINNALIGTNKTVDSTTQLAIYDLDIISKLASLMARYSLRTVVSYIHWYAIDRLAYNTNKKMREITNKFYKEIGLQYFKDTDRYIYCIINHAMHVGLSYAYVHKYMSSDMFSQAEVMASTIKSQLKEQLEQCPWLDSSSKPESQQKVDKMDFKIGYAKKYDEPEKLDDFYHELEVSSDYFDNAVNLKKFHTRTLMNKLWSFLDPSAVKDEWHLEATTVSMIYVQNTNDMTIPAANFQQPWFHLDRPIVFNYGSTGVGMGHEAAHAFGPVGRLYDDNGIYRQWWPTATLEEYDRKAHCFVEQYNRYNVTDNYTNETVKIDGMRTLNENIADNVGVKTSLKAYLFYKTNQKLEDVRIPVLQNYTDMQVFFYALGNTYCGKILYTRESSIYSPLAMRINGVVSNMREFSEAFHCSETSEMNPRIKCDLWG